MTAVTTSGSLRTMTRILLLALALTLAACANAPSRRFPPPP
jgi:starvation-inducible outer membrane lipoprotein